MTTTKTTHTIEITTEEAEVIMKALHKAYKEANDEWGENPKSRTGDREYERIAELRKLRNGFCDITKIFYMGEDA